MSCPRSLSERLCGCLETLIVENNSNLREIEGFIPRSVRKLVIRGCPKLFAVLSFALLVSLQKLELEECFQVKKIEGLDHCRELEVLKAYTWCIQSLCVHGMIEDTTSHSSEEICR